MPAAGFYKFINHRRDTKFNTARLKKGLKCSECHSFGWYTLGSNLGVCNECGTVRGVDQMVTEYFNAFNILLPGQQYKRRDIIDHLRIDISEYTLQKIIRSNFRKLDQKQRIYYFSP